MRKSLIITALVTVALVAIYYLIGSLIPSQKGMGPGNKPVEVIVTSAKIRPVTIYKTLPARIKSAKISEVRPQISGIILEKYFTEGSFVKKGQPLYQIDPKPYFVELTQAKSEVTAAQIDLKSKEDQFNRFDKLYKIQAVSKLQFDEAKTLFEKAKADLAVKKANMKKAEIKIDYTKVLAPIDGKIGRSFFTQGALVQDMQSSPLAIITNLDVVYADISESSAKIEEIQTALSGDDKVEVELLLPGTNSNSLKKGVLKFSEAIIEESTGSISLRAEFENSDHKLLPGLFVKAKLNLGVRNLLTVNQSAVTINPDGTMMVYLVDENNSIVTKQITIEGQNESDWIVSSGLSSGDLVVKEGVQKIRPGSKVMPVMSDEELLNVKKSNENTKPSEAKKIEENQIQKEVKNIEKKIKSSMILNPPIINKKNDVAKIIEDGFDGTLQNEEKFTAEVSKKEAVLYIDKFIKERLELAKKEEFGEEDLHNQALKEPMTLEMTAQNDK